MRKSQSGRLWSKWGCKTIFTNVTTLFSSIETKSNTQLGCKSMEETAPVWSLFEIVHKNCPCQRFFCVYWFTVPSLGANCCWYANYFTSPLPLPPTRSPTVHLPTTNFHSITLVQENFNAKCALCRIVYQAVLTSDFKCLLRSLFTKARRWCSWLAKEQLT